ncbi:unnamed protein product [Spirodela intermedia]|uniref:Uncharacterized protein n=1 Tax=Spirodela intermedia TaxID=51605 RepID=A0A7I8J5E5_SPIIN|nr:unnamed protein product [Spirodela intermedia]CAA6665264.1 unnamed protein product [Spirodela intermedia]
MVQQTIEAHRPGAEIYTGNDLCRQKAIELLEELNLPRGLLPSRTWRRSASTVQPASCGSARRRPSTTPSARPADRRMRRVTGVKSREMLIWIPLGEFFCTKHSF